MTPGEGIPARPGPAGPGGVPGPGPARPGATPGAVGSDPAPTAPDPLASTLQTVERRLDTLDDLSLDLRVRTLAAVEAELRSALETARS